MTLDDIRPHLQQLDDKDILTLLNEVSDEVKRRNTIMQGLLGSTPPEAQRETIRKGFDILMEMLSGKKQG
jgi:hypothetical protein